MISTMSLAHSGSVRANSIAPLCSVRPGTGGAKPAAAARGCNTASRCSRLNLGLTRRRSSDRTWGSGFGFWQSAQLGYATCIRTHKLRTLQIPKPWNPHLVHRVNQCILILLGSSSPSRPLNPCRCRCPSRAPALGARLTLLCGGGQGHDACSLRHLKQFKGREGEGRGREGVAGGRGL